MDRTPNLDLPFIQPSQAQKHVTHNEAIQALDAITQLSVLDRSLSTAPATPAEGDRYIVAAGATGSWADHETEVAAWQDGAWQFHIPKPGWIAWVEDEQILAAWDGTQWITAGGRIGEFNTVAVNGAVADATNRIAANAPATLLNHAGNGHQLKINKNASGDTASLLFQTGFSGRAEFGLAGDDNWHVKVSPDGSAWYDALVVDRNTGNVGFGIGAPTRAVHVSGLLLSEMTGSGAGFIAYRTDGVAAILQAGATSCRFNFSDSGDFAISNNTQANILAGTGGGNGTDFFVAQSSTGNVLLVSEGTGNVGVGTASPSARLDVDGAVKVKSHTVAGIPSAATNGAGAIIFVSDETGGAVLAFSDGSNWRRVTDGAVIS